MRVQQAGNPETEKQMEAVCRKWRLHGREGGGLILSEPQLPSQAQGIPRTLGGEETLADFTLSGPRVPPLPLLAF